MTQTVFLLAEWSTCDTHLQEVAGLEGLSQLRRLVLTPLSKHPGGIPLPTLSHLGALSCLILNNTIALADVPRMEWFPAHVFRMEWFPALVDFSVDGGRTFIPWK